jgi:hypothetical protein
VPVELGPDGIIQTGNGSTLIASTGLNLFLGVQLYNVSGRYCKPSTVSSSLTYFIFKRIRKHFFKRLFLFLS